MPPKKIKEDDDIKDTNKITILKTMNAKYGDRAIYKCDEIAKVTAIPSMSHTLNYCSGIGGFAQGHIHEIFGPSGAGKTAITLGVIANAQSMGLKCLFIDAENRFDLPRAKQFGVDSKALYMSNINIIENVFDLIIDSISTGEIQLVILDSLATLMSEKEYESDMESVDMGKKAQAIGKGLKKILGTLSNIKSEHPDWILPTIILTNQVRQSTSGFGNPEFVPGGQAPKFFCSQRIRIQPKIYLDTKGKEVSLGVIEPDNILIGAKIAHKHVKNTFAPPHRSGSYTLYWDERCIENLDELITLGLVEEIITQGGAWYYFNDQKFQGRDNMINYFQESSSALEKLTESLNLTKINRKNLHVANEMHNDLTDYD